MKVEVVGKLLYHVNLVSKNGEIVLTSETYFSKSNAQRAARKLREALGLKAGK